MFSGIIEELGRLSDGEGGAEGRIAIAASRVLEGTDVGHSVAVNGVCLTVTAMVNGCFVSDVMPETLQRTTLGALRPGDPVNLERALAVGDRLGGHMVAGHVDTVGTVSSSRDDGNARWVTIDAPQPVMRFIAPKGSVAVDGISLTVVDVFESAFTVSLIPHTLESTTAGSWKAGTRVNIEADLVARYVQRAGEVVT
jgi:riboflavin synthase